MVPGLLTKILAEDAAREELEKLLKYLRQFERDFPHGNTKDCEGVIVGLEGAISTATAIIDGLLGGKHDKRMDKFLTQKYKSNYHQW